MLIFTLTPNNTIIDIHIYFPILFLNIFLVKTIIFINLTL